MILNQSSFIQEYYRSPFGENTINVLQIKNNNDNTLSICSMDWLWSCLELHLYIDNLLHRKILQPIKLIKWTSGNSKYRQNNQQHVFKQVKQWKRNLHSTRQNKAFNIHPLCLPQGFKEVPHALLIVYVLMQLLCFSHDFK